MDTVLVKKSILNSFYEVIQDLTLEEVENLKDALTVQEFRLTDDGERFSLSEVKMQLTRKKYKMTLNNMGSDLLLSSIIEESGLNVQQVSKKTNIPPSRFSEWLNGKRVPKWNTLQEIANALDVKIKVEISLNER